MATVIKPSSGDATGVRRFMPPAPPRPSGEPRTDEGAALRAELARLTAELDSARAHAEAEVARIAEARDEGHREGLAMAEDRQAERVAALRGTMTAAVTLLDEKLEGLEGLAAALARAGLSRMFADPPAMAGMVAATLARYLATLRAETVLTVRVSAADFADADPVEAVVRAAGGRAAVVVDADLPAGACRVGAQLGGIDLDVPAQWATLAALLDEMTAPCPTPSSP